MLQELIFSHIRNIKDAGVQCTSDQLLRGSYSWIISRRHLDPILRSIEQGIVVIDGFEVEKNGSWPVVMTVVAFCVGKVMKPQRTFVEIII